MDDDEIREIVCDYVPRMRERVQMLASAVDQHDWQTPSTNPIG